MGSRGGWFTTACWPSWCSQGPGRSCRAVGAEQGCRALPTLFVLAVIANVAYCATYPVDLFLQGSAFRATGRRYRWVLLMTGLLTAAAFTGLALAVLLG